VRLGRVLVAEDEQDVAELIRHHLAKDGYDAVVARTGAAGRGVPLPRAGQRPAVTKLLRRHNERATSAPEHRSSDEKETG
jgi:CheY-like chemotaxis protein